MGHLRPQEAAVDRLRSGEDEFTKLSVAPVAAGAEGIEVIYTTPATGWADQLSRPIWVNVTAVAEDATNATQVSQGIYSQVNFGDADTAALGTVHGYSVAAIVTNSGHASNEFAAHFGYLRNDEQSATPGRNWFSDWGAYSAVGLQQSLHTGINLVFTNFFNGSPSSAESDGLAILAKPGIGPGMTSTTPHWDADSYPSDNAIRVLGTSGDRVTPNERPGFKQAIKIGGTGSGWTITQSWFEKGIELRDFQNFGIHIHTRHSSAVTDAPAIAVASGAGPVVVGGTAVASTGILLNVRTSGTVDPAVELSAEAAASSISHQYRNAEGRFKLFVSGAADSFIAGAAAGDGGVRLGTVAKSFLIGGSSGPVIKVTQDTKLGFYGAAPVAKQTGVAVTAAAVHAALVNLGLIAA